jgi:hypothetical protein
VNRTETKVLRAYLRSVADVIELRDWEVVLADEPSEEGTFGQARCRYGAKRIEIALPTDFPTASTLEEQRDTVTHELVHAHLDESHKLVEEDIVAPLGREARALAVSSYTRAIEHAVDALTKALAKSLPLIEWPKPKKTKR